MDDLTPGPAMQCPMDETLIPVSEADQRAGGPDCPSCGEPMEAVTIETCPTASAATPRITTTATAST